MCSKPPTFPGARTAHLTPVTTPGLSESLSLLFPLHTREEQLRRPCPYLLGVDVIDGELLQGCRRSIAVPGEELSHHLPDVAVGDGHPQQQGHSGHQVHLGNGLGLLERQGRNEASGKDTARQTYTWERGRWGRQPCREEVLWEAGGVKA